jgi:hypothetical protein
MVKYINKLFLFIFAKEKEPQGSSIILPTFIQLAANNTTIIIKAVSVLFKYLAVNDPF